MTSSPSISVRCVRKSDSNVCTTANLTDSTSFRFVAKCAWSFCCCFTAPTPMPRRMSAAGRDCLFLWCVCRVCCVCCVCGTLRGHVLDISTDTHDFWRCDGLFRQPYGRPRPPRGWVSRPQSSSGFSGFFRVSPPGFSPQSQESTQDISLWPRKREFDSRLRHK